MISYGGDIFTIKAIPLEKINDVECGVSAGEYCTKVLEIEIMREENPITPPQKNSFQKEGRKTEG